MSIAAARLLATVIFAAYAYIADDGNLVAFDTDSTDLTAGNISSNISSSGENVFVRNMTTGVTQLVSVDPTGSQASNSVTGGLGISGSGTEVVFESSSTNLLGPEGRESTAFS